MAEIIQVYDITIQDDITLPIRIGLDGHSPYIGENGNWYEWSYTEDDYVDTGIQAHGVTFDQLTPEQIALLQAPAIEAAEQAAEDVASVISAFEIVEGQWEINEGIRESNEDTRELNEGVRESNELIREDNEDTRESNEETRQTQETTRQENETTRGQNEETRQTQETTRQQQEAGRVQAELDRVNSGAALVVDIKAIQPAVAFLKRVTADGGTCADKSLLAKFYTEMNQSLANTHALYFFQLGIKERVSGINRFCNKGYDLGPLNNDGVMATEATQSYVGGYIAQNEFRCLKYLQGQTQTGEITIPTKSYLATDSWTLTMALKANRASGRILVGSTWRIQIEPAYISLQTGSVIIMSGVHSFAWGKTAIIEFQYSNGTALIKVNGIPLVTTPTSSAIDFNKIAYASATPFDGSIYYYHLENVRISESDSQKRYNFLRSLFAEIEGINIGNQNWITSNVEQTVVGNGTVIPEIQSATTSINAELITDASARDFSSDSGWWTKSAGITIAGGVCNIKSTAGESQFIQRNVLLTIGRQYTITLEIVANRSGSLRLEGLGSDNYDIDSTVGIKTYHLTAVQSYLIIKRTGVCDIDIDNASLKLTGWADLTTPAWCYYDNSVANGAVYGKLYNWYAIDLINKYAPQGYRVPTSADFTQLATFLGGTSVAGGKMKKEGLTYWNTPNTGATNENGFSAIGGGLRDPNTGAFINYNVRGYFYTSNSTFGSNYGFGVETVTSEIRISAYWAAAGVKSGQSLRYLRTSPVGENRRQIESGFFTTDIASVAKSINVPHGYVITQIRITTTTNVTSIEAKLFNTAGSAVATLITGKACNATSTVFDVAVDQPTQPTDFTVKTTAVGNSTAGVIGMNITVICEKIQI